MLQPTIADHQLRRAIEFATLDYPTIALDADVGSALESIRKQGIGARIVYFYVVNSDGILAGVVPTRRLLTEPVDSKIADIMIRKVLTIPETATLLEACEFFVLYKFLAFPVVDAERHMKGIIDVNVFTQEILDFGASETKPDDLFQAIGFHVAQIRNASPLKAFRFRFPWLLATIAGGMLCALLSGAFAETLEQRIAIAFFLTLVLGLAESVSAQSMAITIQTLHGGRITWKWLFRTLRKEGLTALLLGLGCGTTAGMLVILWQREILSGLVIGGSIVFSVMTACLLGFLVPTAFRALKLDPKIAAGPLTLALADICTLLIYFSAARLML